MIQTVGSGRWSSDAGEGLTVCLLRREGRNYKSELDEQLGIQRMALPLELCRIFKAADILVLKFKCLCQSKTASFCFGEFLHVFIWWVIEL